MTPKPITDFIDRHYCHFNAAALRDAALGYRKHLDSDGKMFLAMAGAMSTAELGKSLAEMIRKDKIHGISCTGANLEEDLYNLVAHNHYERIPNYRDLTPEHEKELLKRHYNRVTDTCIPENEAIRVIDRPIIEAWKAAEARGERYFPHQYLYEHLRKGTWSNKFQIDPKDSWLVAAAEKNLPLFVPGWEDSTLGNMYAATIIDGTLKGSLGLRGGVEYMVELAKWYLEISKRHSIGFFQIGGGIAGDFPICVVPMLEQDINVRARVWGYFCQISDSTTSYGSYSGAVPNEKITWGKLDVDTPKFIIESDATIVAPLIFSYVLGW